jgi:hypothetical protein
MIQFRVLLRVTGALSVMFCCAVTPALALSETFTGLRYSP